MKKGLIQESDECIICGAEISKATAAKASHMRKHVRDGSLEETKDKDGKLVWKTTGKESKTDDYKPISSGMLLYNTTKFEPRKQVMAKSNKKGEISIRCRVCGNLKTKPIEFADDRFVAIKCCDKMSPFPKRMITTLVENPGKEYTE